MADSEWRTYESRVLNRLRTGSMSNGEVILDVARKRRKVLKLLAKEQAEREGVQRGFSDQRDGKFKAGQGQHSSMPHQGETSMAALAVKEKQTAQPLHSTAPHSDSHPGPSTELTLGSSSRTVRSLPTHQAKSSNEDWLSFKLGLP